MSEHWIMYCCTACIDGYPEGCGHFDRNDLRLMPSGKWLCESCFDDTSQAERGNLDEDEFRNWSDLPAPPSYARLPEAHADGPDHKMHQCPQCLLWYSIYNEAMEYPHVCTEAAPRQPEHRCQKCGTPTQGEEAWIDGQIWCHPCADAVTSSDVTHPERCGGAK